MTCRASFRRWSSSCWPARTERGGGGQGIRSGGGCGSREMNFAGRQRHGRDESRHGVREAALPCNPDNVPEILDHLADVYFYVKDVDSRWQECNSATLTLFNASRKSEVLGKTDWDFYPEEIAGEIIQAARSVIESGRPIVNKLEVIVNEAGRLLWVLTTKTPARNRDGRI